MPIRKGKTKTIITQNHEEITLNKTIPLGANRTPKGIVTTNAKGRKTTTISG
jgi:hypothetical protein